MCQAGGAGPEAGSCAGCLKNSEEAGVAGATEQGKQQEMRLER